MREPQISAVIPVYNRAHTIERAIASVQGQTFGNFELIVVDDGSTDELQAVLKSIREPRLRIISHNKNEGAAAARNTGIAEARADYVAFLDSDDWWLPQKLERQLAFMTLPGQPNRASCTTYRVLTQYAAQGETRRTEKVLRHRDFLLGCRVSPGSTLMAEKALFDEIGSFNEDLQRLEDWDWLLRYTQHEELVVLPDILTEVDYRSDSAPNFEDVRIAAQIMRSIHFRGRQNSKFDRRKFLGVIENELSASAYKNGWYGLALFHFIKSLFYYPYRNFDSVRRILRVIFHDVYRNYLRLYS